MTLDQMLTFGIISITVALFIWNRWRYDIVALGSLFASVLVGIVPADKAFTGFSDPVVVTVACILVISTAISRSGFIDLALRVMNRVTGLQNTQVFLLSGMVMVLSAFMNNVGALAVFLPIAMSFARKEGRKPSEFLMPMAFASLLGGLVTLIGTPPNLMISNIRKDFVGAPYEMFDFAPVGLGVCFLGLLYLTFCWRFLPKDRRGQPLPEERFSIEDYVSEVSVEENSPFIDKTVREVESLIEGEVAIVGLLRSGYRTLAPSGRLKVRVGDVLVIKTDPVTLKNAVDAGKLTLIGSKETEQLSITSDDVGIAEAVVMAGSQLTGSTPREMQLRRRFSVNLLAVRQSDTRRQNRLHNVRFQEGDVIVLQGSLESMPETLSELGCLPLAERNLQLGRPKVLYLPALIMAVAVALAVLDILPLAISFLGGVILIALLRIMRPNEIYSSIDISIIILLGALIPVTQAMQTTGDADDRRCGTDCRGDFRCYGHASPVRRSQRRDDCHHAGHAIPEQCGDGAAHGAYCRQYGAEHECGCGCVFDGGGCRRVLRLFDTRGTPVEHAGHGSGGLPVHGLLAAWFAAFGSCGRARRAHHHMGMGLGRNFENRVDFDGDVERQRRCTHGKTGVLAALTQHIDNQIRCAVDDGGHLVEIRGAGDKAAQLDAANKAGFIAAHGGKRLRQNIQGTGLGGFLAPFN